MSASLDSIEEKIIQYVKDNPGCSKSDIVRFMKDRQILSRIPALMRIDRLEREKIIIYKLDRPNSQLYKIYINEDNKLASVLVELEEFKEAYFNLLEKSKEIINNKDYSADAKALGIEETDPAKWSKADKLRYLREKLVIFMAYEIKEKELNERLQSLLSRSDAEKGDEDQEIEMDRSDAIELKTLLSDLIHILHNVKNYGVLLLTLKPINLFFVFTDILFLRSLLIWSNSIKNEETLSQIYFSVYKKISEIQTQLSEFFGNIKIGVSDPNWTKNIAEFFIKIPRDPNMSLIGMYSYQVFGMQSEIQSVINSLIQLSKEIKDYYYLDPNEVFLIDKLQDDLKYVTEQIKQSESESESESADTTTMPVQPEHKHDYQVAGEVTERIQNAYSKEAEEELKEEKKK